MRILRFIALFLGAGMAPALATPPDLVCSGGDALSPVRFEFPLMTSYADYHSSGVIPLTIYQTSFEYGPPDSRKSLKFYSEHIIGQWLLDGRADLRLYLEDEADEAGGVTSYDLILRTRSTVEVNEDSGQLIHSGRFEFRVFTGSLLEGALEEVIFEAKGRAQCS